MSHVQKSVFMVEQLKYATFKKGIAISVWRFRVTYKNMMWKHRGRGVGFSDLLMGNSSLLHSAGG